MCMLAREEKREQLVKKYWIDRLRLMMSDVNKIYFTETEP